MEEQGKFQTIAISQLRESPLNPRKAFGDLAGLAASIQSVGRVIQPLLVRPCDGGYEIAAGHRRFRAAQLAELSEVPAVIEEMSDDVFLDVLTFENLQRKDLHELEEAAGYKTLMREGRYDAPGIGAKVGKSLSYVYQRLKLLDLIDSAQQAFLDGKLSAGHAVLIARLPEKMQEKALKYLEPPSWNPAQEISVRALKQWIRERVYTSLAEADFPLDDVALALEAGACTTCPKRTGNNPELYDEAEPDLCTDRACYLKKEEAQEERTEQAGRVAQAKTQESSGPSAEEDPINCDLSQFDAKDEEVEKDDEPEAPGYLAENRRHNQEFEKQEKEREAKLTMERTVRGKIFAAIEVAAKWPLGRKTVEDLVLCVGNASTYCERRGLDDLTVSSDQENYDKAVHGASDLELARLAIEALLGDEILPELYDFEQEPTELLATAKRFGVDAAKIRREAEKPPKAAAKKAPADRKQAIAKLPTLGGKSTKKPVAKKAKPAVKKPAAKKRGK